MSEADHILQILARRVRGRVSQANMFSANIGEPARSRLRFSHRGYQATVYAASTKLSVEVPISEGQMLLAMNAPDRICLANKPLDPAIEELPWPVFVYDAEGEARARSWLVGDSVGLFRAIELRSNEALFLYANLVTCVCGLDRDHIGLADLLIDIVGRVPTGTADRFDVSDLPSSLRPLVHQFHAWAISDDEERSEYIGQATAHQRRALLDAIDPLAPFIDDFLASFNDRPLTSGVLLLASLAEAAAEIRAHEA